MTHTRSVTLRTRLLAGLIALLALVSVVIGLVSVGVLDRFLTHRLDDQLTFAVRRSSAAVDRPPDDAVFGQPPPLLRAQPSSRPGVDLGPGPGFLLAPGQSEGTLGALLSDGRVTRGAVLDSRGTPIALTATQQQELTRIPADRQPHTVRLGGRLGQYRVVAATTSNGRVFVTGLPLGGVRAAVYRLTLVVTAVALSGLLLAALAGHLIIKLALSPLRRMAATAGRVAELPLDRGEVALAVRVPDQDADPRHEVGQMGVALNRMLEHVAAALAARHASEARVRRFVADASHELRTPLASIRGYAELTRRGREPLPTDAAHALRRVESESLRMTALVDDLLLLARLDEGRPVERAPVDLSRLLVDTLGDAQAAGPDHHWRLDLPERPVTVIGDDQRLHQVVANLLGNARTHTPPGTPVTVTLLEAQNDGFAVLTVTDEGPGIPEALLPEIFERFTRGDSSRSRAAGSTGLGLAIVAAVVAAHDGQVDVDSRPGRTRFTIRLPAERQSGDRQHQERHVLAVGSEGLNGAEHAVRDVVHGSR